MPIQELEQTVEELELSVRSYNWLKNANIKTVGDLVRKTEANLLKKKDFGRKILNELKTLLAERGLSFGMKSEYKRLPGQRAAWGFDPAFHPECAKCSAARGALTPRQFLALCKRIVAHFSKSR